MNEYKFPSTLGRNTLVIETPPPGLDVDVAISIFNGERQLVTSFGQEEGARVAFSILMTLKIDWTKVPL